MLHSFFANDYKLPSPGALSQTVSQPANSLLSYIWPETSVINESSDELNSCTVDVLREKSIGLNILIRNADNNLQEIAQKLSRAEGETRSAKENVINKHTFAYEKLKDLDQKKNRLKYRVFTELDLNKEESFGNEEVFNLPPPTKEFNHGEYLVTLPSTEENVIKIDRTIKKYIDEINKLALKKMTMQLEINEMKIQEEFNFQTESMMMSHAFKKRKDLYARIHSALLNTSRNIQEFNIPLQPVALDFKGTIEEEGSFGGYLPTIFQFISKPALKTGFESQTNNIFHRLCLSYLAASEEADKAFDEYTTSCKKAFEIFNLFEKSQAAANSLKERKLEIQAILHQKAQGKLAMTSQS